MQFSFSQEELFNALSVFQGHKRRSLMGMYKKCSSIEQMTSIGNFLAYNKLGGWYYYIAKDKLVCYCFLNSINTFKIVKELIAA